MSIQSKGVAREHQVKRRWEAEGWVAARSAGSKSPVDLWMMRSWGIEGFAEVFCLQIKGNRGSAWMNFRAKERRELADLAHRAGAIPLLIHWPPNGEEREYTVDEWPKTKERA